MIVLRVMYPALIFVICEETWEGGGIPLGNFSFIWKTCEGQNTILISYLTRLHRHTPIFLHF